MVKFSKFCRMDLAALDNNDLLTKILLRLPAKSLIRFKKWLSIISSDYLCHQHTLRHPKLQSSSLILTTNTRKLLYFNSIINGEKTIIPYRLSVPDHHIAQACNGLLLLACNRSSYYVDFDPTSKKFVRRPEISSYCVYNPTTRRSRKIVFRHNDKYPLVAGIGLAFDPSKSPYYTIVCIRCTEELYHPYMCNHQIEVYDLESKTRKLGSKVFIDPLTFTFSPYGEYCNNVVYWISVDGHRCVCFDIAKNEMKTLSSPRFPYCQFYVSHLQESNGRLYHIDKQLVLDYGIYGRTPIVVWEMGGDDQSEWIFKHSRDITSTAENSTNILRFVNGDGDGDGDGTRSLVISQAEKIRAYSFSDRSYEDLVDITKQPFYQSRNDGFGAMAILKGFLFGEILALV